MTRPFSPPPAPSKGGQYEPIPLWSNVTNLRDLFLDCFVPSLRSGQALRLLAMTVRVARHCEVRSNPDTKNKRHYYSILVTLPPEGDSTNLSPSGGGRGR